MVVKWSRPHQGKECCQSTMNAEKLMIMFKYVWYFLKQCIGMMDCYKCYDNGTVHKGDK